MRANLGGGALPSEASLPGSNYPQRKGSAEVMDKNERVVSFYDLRFFSRMHGDETQIANLPIAEALALTRTMWEADHLEMGKKAIQITLDDWVYSARHQEHHLVFNRADASMDDIPLKDRKTKKRRMAGKTIDEGIDLTAHILIKLPKKVDENASLLMTGGSSLASADIGRYLGLLFRQAKRTGRHEKLFRREHPGGELGRTIALTPHFALEAHPSVTITEILRKGQLEGVELVALSDSKFDSEKTFTVTQKALKLEIVQPGKSMLLKTFRAAIAGAAKALGGDEPDVARLTYKPEGEKSQTTSLPIDDLEQVFVKKDRIKFEQPILPMYEKVVPIVIDKLRLLL